MNVLLQPAQRYGSGRDRSKKLLASILFDSGSQRRCVSEEMVKKLGLKVEKKVLCCLMFDVLF